MLRITTDYVWLNGKRMSQYECDAYNAASERIESIERIGGDAEHIRNGRFNMVATFLNRTGPPVAIR